MDITAYKRAQYEQAIERAVRSYVAGSSLLGASRRHRVNTESLKAELAKRGIARRPPSGPSLPPALVYGRPADTSHTLYTPYRDRAWTSAEKD
jgi:hypothetical protein